MHSFLWYFLMAYSVFFMSLVSPGPDFALVMKNTVGFGKASAWPTALGIALANWIHILLAVLGLSVAMTKFPALEHSVRYAGACYMLYLSVGCFRSTGVMAFGTDQPGTHSKNTFDFFKQGFVTNTLNPKAAIFFLSFFSALPSAVWTLERRWLLAVCMTITAFVWFYVVATLIGRFLVSKLTPVLQRRISIGLGALFALFALTLVLS